MESAYKLVVPAVYYPAGPKPAGISNLPCVLCGGLHVIGSQAAYRVEPVELRERDFFCRLCRAQMRTGGEAEVSTINEMYTKQQTTIARERHRLCTAAGFGTGALVMAAHNIRYEQEREHQEPERDLSKLAAQSTAERH